MREIGAADASPFFISVVIVNYSGAPFLERCLAALAAQTFRNFEIILVDNASTDDSCAFVEKNFPQVQLIRSETNVGFAAGNNLGLGAARGNLIATLNTDTEVEPNYLGNLCAPMQNKTVGACAPLMLEMEQRAVVDAAGIVVDAFGYAWNVGAGKSANKFATTREIFGACAGAALYRKAMLGEIGWFDADYFAFYEDADLAWRAHNAGWKTIFVPAARVYHTHGASFGKIAPRKTYLLARNRWWTTFKNFRTPQFYFALPLLVLLDAFSLVQAATRGHFQPAWQGRIDAWRGLKKMRAKRRTTDN
jgi:GT2 family glycosyltransferase